MTWIGGIFSKVNMSRDELKQKLTLMTESAFPASEPSAAYPRRILFVLNETRGQALAQVSTPTERTLPEHIDPDYREKPSLIFDGHVYDFGKAQSKLSPVQHGSNETAVEPLIRLMAKFPGTLEQKVRRALTGLDGDYALAVTDADKLVISRDSLGTRPLYFAENSRLITFASNKKPVWQIGLDEVRPLRAGKLAVFDHEGVSVKKAWRLRKRAIEIESMAKAVNVYEQVLRPAVGKRLTAVKHIRKVGVLLSGGVDSCLIAKLVQDAASGLGMEVVAYTAGLRDSPDERFAREFARELGVKHVVKTLSSGEVEHCIPKVIEAIEDSNFVQVETGIGLYAAINMAGRDGTRVVFSGQGPDELWGGYNWYPNVLRKDGRQELCRRMRGDFTRTDIETLDRENKIALAHDVDLFFPYLDTEVVNVAMSVASELKVPSERDRLGKHPHRQLAAKMGIPEKYANREKLAIQHGTGIHAVLDDIARRNGFDPALVKSTGYRSEEITTAKLGSSTRYGYRYVDKKLWEVPQHVQFFLQALAHRKGLLDRSVRDRVGYFLARAGLPKES
jgi:asparagine synthase (glutamine-hydrolysing)